MAKNQYLLTELEDALKIIQDVVLKRKALKNRLTEFIFIEDALGRISAEDIYSPVEHPGFRASIMDGYAISSINTKNKNEKKFPNSKFLSTPLHPDSKEKTFNSQCNYTSFRLISKELFNLEYQTNMTASNLQPSMNYQTSNNYIQDKIESYKNDNTQTINPLVNSCAKSFNNMNKTKDIKNIKESNISKNDVIIESNNEKDLIYKCYQVSTGELVPNDFIAVIPFEECTLNEDFCEEEDEENIEITVSIENTILEKYKINHNVRPIGSDINKGDVIISANTKINPVHISLLTTIGIGYINVYNPLKIALFSTGDELIKLPKNNKILDLPMGMVFESNSIMMHGLLDDLYVDIVCRDIILDNYSSLSKKINSTLELHHPDIIISTGGVSVGIRDHVRKFLENERDVHVHVSRLNLKPGKPTMFASFHKYNTIYFGLPGNPVSAFVTFSLLIKPAILTWTMSSTDIHTYLPHKIPVHTLQNIQTDHLRPEWKRCVITQITGFKLYNHKTSNIHNYTSNQPNQVNGYENNEIEINQKIDSQNLDFFEVPMLNKTIIKNLNNQIDTNLADKQASKLAQLENSNLEKDKLEITSKEIYNYNDSNNNASNQKAIDLETCVIEEPINTLKQESSDDNKTNFEQNYFSSQNTNCSNENLSKNFDALKIFSIFDPFLDRTKNSLEDLKHIYTYPLYIATLTGNQISSRLLSCSSINGLIYVPPYRICDIKIIDAFQPVYAYVIGNINSAYYKQVLQTNQIYLLSKVLLQISPLNTYILDIKVFEDLNIDESHIKNTKQMILDKNSHSLVHKDYYNDIHQKIQKHHSLNLLNVEQRNRQEKKIQFKSNMIDDIYNKNEINYDYNTNLTNNYKIDQYQINGDSNINSDIINQPHKLLLEANSYFHQNSSNSNLSYQLHDDIELHPKQKNHFKALSSFSISSPIRILTVSDTLGCINTLNELKKINNVNTSNKENILNNEKINSINENSSNIIENEIVSSNSNHIRNISNKKNPQCIKTVFNNDNNLIVETNSKNDDRSLFSSLENFQFKDLSRMDSTGNAIKNLLENCLEKYMNISNNLSNNINIKNTNETKNECIKNNFENPTLKVISNNKNFINKNFHSDIDYCQSKIYNNSMPEVDKIDKTIFKDDELSQNNEGKTSYICKPFVCIDDIEHIQAVVKLWIQENTLFIVINGGTGPAERDITTEAILPLLDKRFFGIEHAIYTDGLKQTPFAALGRILCGISHKSLIISIPGSTKAATQAIETISPILPHLLSIIQQYK